MSCEYKTKDISLIVKKEKKGSKKNKGRKKTRPQEKDEDDEVRVRRVNMTAMHKRSVTLYVGAHCLHGEWCVCVRVCVYAQTPVSPVVASLPTQRQLTHHSPPSSAVSSCLPPSLISCPPHSQNRST